MSPTTARKPDAPGVLKDQTCEERHALDSAALAALQTRLLAAGTVESVAEVKKVVWPTRKETMQTTAAVFAFVVVMAVFLWVSDKTLEWVLYELILGWKKT